MPHQRLFLPQALAAERFVQRLSTPLISAPFAVLVHFQQESVLNAFEGAGAGVRKP